MLGRRVQAVPSSTRLRTGSRYFRILADETVFVSSVTFTIRVIIPEEVNSTVALQTLSASTASAPKALVSSLAGALNASNYTDPKVPVSLSVDLLSSSGDPVGNGTVSIFSIVQPLPPLVEITSQKPGTVPTSTGSADSGGGGAGGAAGAIIVVLLLGFLGLAYYYIRKTGSFLGCTFGPLADCFGLWPLSEYAERNRQAIKNKDIWSGKGKDGFISPIPGKKKVLSTEDNVCPPIDMNEIMQSHNTVMNPVHQMGASRRGGTSAHFNVTYDNFDNNNNFNNNGGNNNNRQNFAPLGNLASNPTMNGPMTMGMQINMVQQQKQQQQQQQIAMNPLRAMQQPPPYPMNNNMMVSFNPMDTRLQQSALKIQSVFRGHHVRRQTHTEALAGRMGKAALQTNNAMSKAMAQNVARAAGQLAAVENKAKQASVVSNLNHTKKKKQMTDLEAALLLQRMYKGYKLRKALKGWIKVVDDDGDVFYKNELTDQLEWVLPSMPFNPVNDESGNDEEGEVDYEYDDDGNLWYLDGPGGQRLAWGWRRCEDGDDVWYTNDDEGESSWEPVYAE